MLQQQTIPQMYGNPGYNQASYQDNDPSGISATTRTGGNYAQSGIMPSQPYANAAYTQGINAQPLAYPYNLAGSEGQNVSGQP